MTLQFELPRAARSGVALFPIVLALAGCAATITQDGVEQRTAIAIGRPAGSFTISNPAEGTAGRIDYSVNTKDGNAYSGIIARDDATGLVLKVMGGAEVALPRSNIKGSSSSGKSIMPEGLEAGLSVQDMADLLTYIEELK